MIVVIFFFLFPFVWSIVSFPNGIYVSTKLCGVFKILKILFVTFQLKDLEPMLLVAGVAQWFL